MLPNDPSTSAVDGGPSDPSSANVADQATPSSDLPVLTPVVPAAPPPPRRRGWGFAVSIVLVAVMAGGALFLSGYQLGLDNGSSNAGAAADRAAFQPFWDAYTAITTRYPLDTVDRTALVEGAIKGMVEAVGDPYSSYLSPDDYTTTLQDISGQFEGIGAEIGSVDANGNTSDCATFGPNCFLVIIAPIEGSPAEKAGLKPGDIILQVDGSTLDGLTPDEARDRVRGKAGTEVKLRIQRFESPAPVATPGATGAPSGSASPSATPKPRKLLEEFDVTLTRDKIQRREVTSRELAGGTVGYDRLSGFSDGGAKELHDALKAQIDKGIKKIVLDLRGNPGGFITAARSVASDFIATGPVFWEQDAKGVQNPTDAEPDGVATDPSIKVVVLIDKGSASASEIVAGALQDTKRAQLIGQTSFGKGTVQEWLPLGALGGLKLTVYKWLTPEKRWIHKIGLTPDVPVTVPASTPPGEDPVLDKAVEVLGGTGLAPVALPRAA
ncbi:MAG TPA: S41 family peptidase [Candidatus Limnocylindrales bacterium]|nr:S41 family peptidase [Candidatus Limnocylindrales bacterium]